ncbi:MAG: hypothetical protein ACYDEA_12275 [Candidatus Dormibacteria bacterium]
MRQLRSTHLPGVLLLLLATLATGFAGSVRLAAPGGVPAAVRAVAWQTALAYGHPYPTLPYSWVSTTFGAWEHLNRARGPESLGTRLFVVRLQGRFQLPTSFATLPASFVEVAFPARSSRSGGLGFVGIEYVAGWHVPALSSLGQVGEAELPRRPVATGGGWSHAWWDLMCTRPTRSCGRPG